MIGEWVTDVVPENGSRPYVSTTAPLGSPTATVQARVGSLKQVSERVLGVPR